MVAGPVLVGKVIYRACGTSLLGMDAADPLLLGLLHLTVDSMILSFFPSLMHDVWLTWASMEYRFQSRFCTMNGCSAIVPQGLHTITLLSRN